MSLNLNLGKINRIANNKILGDQRFHIFFLFIILLVVHGQSLQYFFVQDDAHAYFASEHWAKAYFGISQDLQYRPNAYLVTYIIDFIFPDKAWPLRLTGICILFLISLFLYKTLFAITKNKTLAWNTSVLNLVHPGYYSMMTLYLSSVMTGLGLLFSILAIYATYNFVKKGSIKAYWSSFLFFLVALFSYEAAVISLPLMLCVVFFAQNDLPVVSLGFYRRLRYSLFNLLPHLFILTAYLVLRMRAIYYHSKKGSIGNYSISVESAWSNARYLLESLYGKYILLTFMEIPFDLFFGGVGFLLVLLSSYFYAKINNFILLYFFALISIPIGFLPFVLVGANGHTLHFVIYALPGFSLLLAMSTLLFFNFDKPRLLRKLLFFSLLFYFCFVNYAAYKNKVLVNQAEIGENISRQFLNLSEDVLNRRAVSFLNTPFRLAAAIHFGETLDIFSRKNRRAYYFPQMDQAQSQSAGVSEIPISPATRTAILHLEHFRVNEQFVDSKLWDVSSYVDDSAARISFEPQLKTNLGDKGVEIIPLPGGGYKYVARENLDYIALVIPPNVSNVPYSVWYEIENSPTSSRLVVDAFFREKATESFELCRSERSFTSGASKIMLGFASPPRRWAGDEYVALTLYAVNSGEAFTLLSATSKESFELPRQPLLQRCTSSMFLQSRLQTFKRAEKVKTEIIRWGPQSVELSDRSLRRANGDLGIWFEQKGISSSKEIEIWFGDERLTTTAYVKPNEVVTFDIPVSLLGATGSRPLFIKLTTTGEIVPIGTLTLSR